MNQASARIDVARTCGRWQAAWEHRMQSLQRPFLPPVPPVPLRTRRLSDVSRVALLIRR